MAQNDTQLAVAYKVFYPGGNTTALVFGGQKTICAATARAIMASDATIEQVGFVQPHGESFKLHMMGGEFCVNAARSAACHWLLEHQKNAVTFLVSGFPQKITARKKETVVSLTLPASVVVSNAMVFDGYLVELQGISYLVTTKKDVDTAVLVRSYYNGAPAFGIIYAERLGGTTLRVEPTVWVRETGTLIKETACGSGSIAACVPFANPTTAEQFTVQQPSGEVYRITFNRGTIKPTIVIGGDVTYLGEQQLVLAE